MRKNKCLECKYYYGYSNGKVIKRKYPFEYEGFEQTNCYECRNWII